MIGVNNKILIISSFTVYITTESFIKQQATGYIMPQETVIIPKKEYEELLEEVGILRNSKMMDAIKESDEAKKRGVKSWELKY